MGLDGMGAKSEEAYKETGKGKAYATKSVKIVQRKPSTYGLKKSSLTALNYIILRCNLNTQVQMGGGEKLRLLCDGIYDS